KLSLKLEQITNDNKNYIEALSSQEANPKVIYETKFVELESSGEKTNYDLLSKYRDTEIENRKLKAELNQFGTISDALKDSINTLYNKMYYLSKKHKEEIGILSETQNTGFEIKINQKALAKLKNTSPNQIQYCETPNRIKINILNRPNNME
ncbi:hypothetical protein OAA06_02045, partial [bacterium]|nr:hypothetical protein [bacterium]